MESPFGIDISRTPSHTGHGECNLDHNLTLTSHCVDLQAMKDSHMLPQTRLWWFMIEREDLRLACPKSTVTMPYYIYLDQLQRELLAFIIPVVNLTWGVTFKTSPYNVEGNRVYM